MTSKFADKSGCLTPSVTGCRENYRIPGFLSGSRRNRRRPVAYAHHIVRCGHESEHPAHPFLSAVTRFSGIAEDFIHSFAQALIDDVGGVAVGRQWPNSSPCCFGPHAARHSASFITAMHAIFTN
jgi:hypothetical protein